MYSRDHERGRDDRYDEHRGEWGRGRDVSELVAKERSRQHNNDHEYSDRMYSGRASEGEHRQEQWGGNYSHDTSDNSRWAHDRWEDRSDDGAHAARMADRDYDHSDDRHYRDVHSYDRTYDSGGRDDGRNWAEEHSYERSRSRDRDRDRDRDRGRDRSRDASQDRERSWKEDSDRDRHERSRDRSRERERGWDRYDDYDRNRKRERQEPNKSVQVKGIPIHAQRNEIWEAFSSRGAQLSDVRMVQPKGGVPRDFAFVEFASVEEAKQWVEGSQPITIGTHTVYLSYCITKFSGDEDWLCERCGTQNFKRRTECFTCNEPQSKTGRILVTTNVLICHGLASETGEDEIYQSFVQFSDIKEVRLIREHDSGISKGFAFLSYADNATCTDVLKYVREMEPPLEIGGCRIRLEYARGKNAFDQRVHDDANGGKGSSVVANAAIQAAMAMSAAAASQASIYGAPQTAKAIEPILRKEGRAKNAEEQAPTENIVATIPQGLSYDETTGFYFDPNTLYYWDAVTGYFYDGTSGTYLTFDQAAQTYVPVSAGQAAKAKAIHESQAKEKAKKTQSINAKKALQDMERWEKKRKKRKVDVPKKTEFVAIEQSQPAVVMEAGPAIGADSGVEIGVEIPEEAKLLAKFSHPDLDAWEAAQRRKHVNIEQLACLLCKRRIATAEKLEKHVRISDLHLKNLESSKEKIMSSLTSEQIDTFEQIQRSAAYRDRAAERRGLYGQPAKIKQKRPGKSTAPKRVEQPTKHGIGDDNKGAKMLKMMGWNKGQGLGKSGQGITAPIQAEMRLKGAGIGAAPTYSADDRPPDDGYAANVAAMARHRFASMQ